MNNAAERPFYEELARASGSLHINFTQFELMTDMFLAGMHETELVLPATHALQSAIEKLAQSNLNSSRMKSTTREM